MKTKQNKLCAVIAVLTLLLLSGCGNFMKNYSNLESTFEHHLALQKEQSKPNTKTNNTVENIITGITGQKLNANDLGAAAKVKTYNAVNINNGPNQLPTEKYYNYSTLPEKYKKAYKTLAENIAKYATGFILIGKGFNQQEIGYIYAAVKNDYPEYFWLPYNYYYYSDNKTQNTYIALEYEGTFGNSKISNHYTVKNEKRQEIANKINQVLAKIDQGVANATANASGMEKQYLTEKYLHDYICEQTVYDDAAAATPRSSPTTLTIEGVLCNKKAICEGYSRTMQFLMYRYGYKTTLACGKTKENDGHMWNVVFFGNDAYQLDVTYDDNETVYSHTYFNLTDREIKYDHNLFPTFSANLNQKNDYNVPLPSCNATAYNYYFKENALIKAGENVNSAVIKCVVAHQNQNRCEIALDNQISEAERINMINSLNINTVSKKLRSQKIYIDTNLVYTIDNRVIVINIK